MSVQERDVLSALSTVMDPDLNQDIVKAGFIKDLKMLHILSHPNFDFIGKRRIAIAVSATRPTSLTASASSRSFAEGKATGRVDHASLPPGVCAPGKGGTGCGGVSASSSWTSTMPRPTALRERL